MFDILSAYSLPEKENKHTGPSSRIFRMDEQSAIPGQRVSSRSTKGKLPKRFISSDADVGNLTQRRHDERSVRTSASERRIAKEVERLHAELDKEAEVAKLRQESIAIQLDLMKKASTVERAKSEFRRRSSASAYSENSSEDRSVYSPSDLDRPVVGTGRGSTPQSADGLVEPTATVTDAAYASGDVEANPVEMVLGQSPIVPPSVTGSASSDADDDETEVDSCSSDYSRRLPLWYVRELRNRKSNSELAGDQQQQQQHVSRSTQQFVVRNPGRLQPTTTLSRAVRTPAHPVSSRPVPAVDAAVPSPPATISAVGSSTTSGASATRPHGVDGLSAQRAVAASSAAPTQRSGFVSQAFAPMTALTAAAPPFVPKPSVTVHGAATSSQPTISREVRPGLTYTSTQAYPYQPMPVPQYMVSTAAPQYPSSQAHAVPAHQIGQHQGAPTVTPAYRPSGHLKALKLPMFDGNEDNYVRWRQKFMGLVGADPNFTEYYKMARLREALAGGCAEELIEDVMDGPGAYQAAMQEIEAWYGGEDRQIERHEQEIITWPKITTMKDTEKIKKFALKLRSVLVNMRSCGITPGRELYLAATEKVPSSMLLKYFEKYDDQKCDVQSFADWLLHVVHMMRKVDERQRNSYKSQAVSSSSSSDKRQAAAERQSACGSQRTKLSERRQHYTLTTAAESSERKSAGTPKSCIKCGKQHQLADCHEFAKMSVAERWSFVKPLNICICCLRPAKHRSAECRNKPCDMCGRKHHRMLHSERKPSEQAPVVKAQTAEGDKAGAHSSAAVNVGASCFASDSLSQSQHVSFMTVPVTVKNGPHVVEATALLDSASSVSFIREDLAKQLSYSGDVETLTTTVLGGKTIRGDRERVAVTITRQGGDEESAFSAFVLPTVTGAIKPVDWNAQKQNWTHLSDIRFPRHQQHAQVDILIGLNAAQLHTSLEERHGKPGDPLARLTPLGWVCYGATDNSYDQPEMTCVGASLVGSTQDLRLDELVNSFWELEKVGMGETYSTPDEQRAEQLVTESIQHDGSRFEMGIPWSATSGIPSLESNAKQAEQRLQSLERSLAKRPAVYEAYRNVLSTYMTKHYIEEVEPTTAAEDGSDQWYLPHFPVVRNDRVTTKVRVVFDASVNWGGTSMNEEMYAGRKTQNNIVHVLLRFCLEPVALVGDISEMFLQIQLRQQDRKYHRFLWRHDPQHEPKVYQFNRIVFGVKASPYLAGRALEETSNKFGHLYSADVSAAVHDDTYVDDLLHSCADDDTAKRVRLEVKSLLHDGGFNIRKWLSNSAAVMADVPEEDRAPGAVAEVGDHSHGTLPSTKTLGVTWNAESDKFLFVFSGCAAEQMTKRTVLKEMSTVFDPRGQICPFTIRSRMMFQQLCIKGYGWDDQLDEHDAKAWTQWFSELPSLSAVQVDRCFKVATLDPSTAEIQVHTFTDASDGAYAAATYIRCQYPDGTVKTTLALAKARPSPIRKLSIPKLELKAAVLGTKLSLELEKALNLPVRDHVFWTDSMNVLYWVRSHSRKFQTDIGNKISEIHAATSGAQWRHIPGRLNPADLPSRGLTAEKLADNEVWWSGPEFLSSPPDQWPIREITVPSYVGGETKRALASAFVTTAAEPAQSRLSPARYSSWKRLLRVTCWCLRFLRNCKQAAGSTKASAPATSDGLLQPLPASSTEGSCDCSGSCVPVPELSAEEMVLSERYWLSVSQRVSYGRTISRLERGQPLENGDPLLPLNPELDTSQHPAVLIVGGRLDNASTKVTACTRRPVILPPKHQITSLVIASEDEKCHHEFGVNYLLANLRQRYWIVRGKQAVKSHRHGCNGCRRRWNRPASQLMGQLPEQRVAITERVFSGVGVDYAGPFSTRQGRGRSRAKRYLCLFTCLETRACHLEMAYDMTAQGFLMCFSRFCKRRGTPKDVVSDNGTNFVATEAELRDAVEELERSEDVAADMASNKINWRFNPPSAPHHGGVFESMIKLAKRAVYAVLENGVCSDEELATAFVHAEAMLNARPLTSISDDAEDLEPLTPLHFLVGHRDIHHAIDHLEPDGQPDPHDRWRVVQRLTQDVWRRLVKEVVPTLNVRQKWQQKKRNIKVGDVVICVDAHTPRSTWPLGRVVAVYPAEDGCVRVVDVKIRKRVYRRAINVLIPLESEQ